MWNLGFNFIWKYCFNKKNIRNRKKNFYFKAKRKKRFNSLLKYILLSKNHENSEKLSA